MMSQLLKFVNVVAGLVMNNGIPVEPEGLKLRGIDEGVTTSATRLTQVTYADMVAAFMQHEAPAVSIQQENNRLSALSRFQEFLGRGKDSPVGPEFGIDFPKFLADFLAEGQLLNKSAGTLANHKTLLKQWKLTWDRFIEANRPFTRLCDALEHYCTLAKSANPKLSKPSLALAAGLHKNYITTAIKAQRVKAHRVANVTVGLGKLEVLLGAPPNSLTIFAQKDFKLPSGSSSLYPSEYAQKLLRLSQTPYALVELPAQLKSEFSELVKFKTALVTAPLKRNEAWRLRPKKDYADYKSRFEIVSPDGKNYAPTAGKAFGFVSSFFGALKSNGYDPENFSLAYMADMNLMGEYLEFMRERGGSITNTVIDCMMFTQSLIFEKFGFLRQQPKFGSRLLTPVPQEDWDVWCEAQRVQSIETVKELRKNRQVKKGRVTDDNIKDILDRNQPITALFELRDNMAEFLNRNSGLISFRDRLSLERDLLLVRMIIVQPLRIQMFRIMTYLPNNKGNLYRRATGVWAIRFKPEDFKNENGAAKIIYDVPFNASFNKLFERYFSEIRPEFGDDRPLVFVSFNRSDSPIDRNTSNLSAAFRRRTRQFLPACPAGFGPHAVRHIVATDYIKNHPSGFEVAAAVLHDTIQTVLKHYAHLKSADKHKVYQKYLESTELAWSNGS
ncbi:site-specific integrase [Macromonas bipunctata]|uniref:site-specific integrase n=1 Tax=Macromonas bipunctata TaxID=183670 RepID=UPI0011AECCE4|nr:site-specific integrase [Macromonas bipunctata]